jgi:hypothetical protein
VADITLANSRDLPGSTPVHDVTAPRHNDASATRNAVRLAKWTDEATIANCAQGVRFVDLAPLSDPHFVDALNV